MLLHTLINYSILFIGDRARLIVASDADLRILDPYKPGDNSHTNILSKNNSRPG